MAHRDDDLGGARHLAAFRRDVTYHVRRPGGALPGFDPTPSMAISLSGAQVNKCQPRRPRVVWEEGVQAVILLFMSVQLDTLGVLWCDDHDDLFP